MESRPKPLFRTLAITAIVLAGLCFGNLLHQVLSHGPGHDRESPLTCWVCAATQHAPGNLGNDSGAIIAPSLAPTDVPQTAPAPPLSTEYHSASPRAPPHSA